MYSKLDMRLLIHKILVTMVWFDVVVNVLFLSHSRLKFWQNICETKSGMLLGRSYFLNGSHLSQATFQLTRLPKKINLGLIISYCRSEIVNRLTRRWVPTLKFSIVHCVMIVSCKKRMLWAEVCLCFEMIVLYTTMHQYCYETSYMSFVLFAVLSSCKISIFIYLLSELFS